MQTRGKWFRLARTGRRMQTDERTRSMSRYLVSLRLKRRAYAIDNPRYQCFVRGISRKLDSSRGTGKTDECCTCVEESSSRRAAMSRRVVRGVPALCSALLLLVVSGCE